jgi:predicted RNA-binding Zn-ribbon protein involved in translation (DUF1610 family)
LSNIVTRPVLCEGTLREDVVRCPKCGGHAIYRSGREKAFLRCDECGHENSWDL